MSKFLGFVVMSIVVTFALTAGNFIISIKSYSFPLYSLIQIKATAAAGAVEEEESSNSLRLRHPRQVSFAGTVDDILDSAFVVDAPVPLDYLVDGNIDDDDELTRNFGSCSIYYLKLLIIYDISMCCTHRCLCISHFWSSLSTEQQQPFRIIFTRCYRQSSRSLPSFIPIVPGVSVQ